MVTIAFADKKGLTGFLSPVLRLDCFKSDSFKSCVDFNVILTSGERFRRYKKKVYVSFCCLLTLLNVVVIFVVLIYVMVFQSMCCALHKLPQDILLFDLGGINRIRIFRRIACLYMAMDFSG